MNERSHGPRPLTILALVSTAGCLATTPPQTPAPPPPPAADLTAPRVTGFTAEPHGVTLKTTFGALAVTAVNDHVIRVRASRGATFAKDLSPDFSWAVVPGANAAT